MSNMYLCLVHLNGCRNERLYLMELRTFICSWNQHTALSGMMNRPGPGHSTRSTSKPNYHAEYWFSFTVIQPFSIGSVEAAVSSESYVNWPPPRADDHRTTHRPMFISTTKPASSLCLVRLNGSRNEHLYPMELLTFVCSWKRHASPFRNVESTRPWALFHSINFQTEFMMPSIDFSFITVIRLLSVGSDFSLFTYSSQ